MLKNQFPAIYGPNQEVIRGAELSTKAILGFIHSPIAHSFQFNSDSTLIYPCEAHLAVVDVVSKEFLCIPRQKPQAKVTCLKVTNQNKTQTTLVAETHNAESVLYIQTVECVWALSHKHLPLKEFITKAFLHGSICYTMTQHTLSVWQLESQALVTHKKLPEGCLSIELKSSKQVLVWGSNYLKLWELLGEELQETQSIEDVSPVDLKLHPTQTDKFVVLTTQSQLLVFEKFQVKSRLDVLQGASCLVMSSEECLVCGGLRIQVYFVDENLNFDLKKELEIPKEPGSILEGSYSPNEAKAVLTVYSDELHPYLFDSLSGSVDSVFGSGFPKGQIQDLALASQREAVCAVTKDRTLKMWEYFQGWKCSAAHKLLVEPRCIAVHPSGFQITVGSESSAKVFYFLHDSFSVELIVPKRVEAAAYNEEGSALAIAQNNQIAIYDPYTLEVCFTLQSHSGIVNLLNWEKNLLTSACLYGKFTVWRVSEDYEKLIESANFSGAFKSIYYDKDKDLVMGVNEDKVLRIWGEAGSNLKYESKERDLTAMCVSRDQEMVFLGTFTGEVRAMLYPKAKGEYLLDEPQFMQWKINNVAVTSLYLLENSIFAASGCELTLLRVKFIEEGECRSIARESRSKWLNSYSLVTSSYLEMQKEEIQQIGETINSIESDTIDIDEEQKNFTKKFNELKEYYETKISEVDNEIKDLEASIEQKLKTKRETKTQKEKLHRQRLIKQNEEYNAKLKAEFDKYDKLQTEKQEEIHRINTQKEELQKMQQEVLEKAKEDYEHRKLKIKEATQQLSEAITENQKRFLEMKSQVTNEYQTIKQKEQHELNNEVQKEKNQGRICVGKQTKFARENRNLNEELQTLKQNSAELTEANKTLEQEKQFIETSLVEQENELKKREETIRIQEANIGELRSLHIHLKNFRFVLDQKIKSLREERKPMETHFAELKDHFAQLTNELLEEHNTQTESTQLLETLKQKHQKLTQKNDFLKKEMIQSKADFREILSDLALLLEKKEVNELLKGLKKLYTKHMDSENSQLTKRSSQEQFYFTQTLENHKNTKNETQMQNKFIESTLKAIESKKNLLEKHNSKQLSKKQHENICLIKECNELREKKQELKKKRSEFESTIKRLKYCLTGGTFSETTNKKSTPKETPYQELTKKKTTSSGLKSPILQLDSNKSELSKQNQQLHSLVKSIELSPSTNFTSKLQSPSET